MTLGDVGAPGIALVPSDTKASCWKLVAPVFSLKLQH